MEELEKQTKRLDALLQTFSKGPHKRVTKTEELVMGFLDQVKRGRKLSKKQLAILGDWEYQADTKGSGWDLKK